MDTVTQITAIRDAVGAGVMAPNEGRAKLDLKPVEGGESPYLQQQNYLAGGARQARRAGRSVRARKAASTAAAACSSGATAARKACQSNAAAPSQNARAAV